MIVFILLVIVFFVLISLFNNKENNVTKNETVSFNRQFVTFVINQLNEDVDKEFDYYIDNNHCKIEEIVPIALNKSKKELLKNAELFSQSYLIPLSQIYFIIEDCTNSIYNARK